LTMDTSFIAGRWLVPSVRGTWSGNVPVQKAYLPPVQPRFGAWLSTA
jgi:hypothetical protein